MLLPTGFNDLRREVQRPLAAVVVFGLATSTFLTLFVLPSMYEWVEARWIRKGMDPGRDHSPG